MKNPYLFILLFVISDLSLAQWSQIGQDIDGEAPGDQSGYAVSLNSSGSIAAIGAFNNNGIFNSAGHVRVFENSNGNWVQMGSDIDGEAFEDYSGKAPSINSDGLVIAIGAYLNDGNGFNSGHARVYGVTSSFIENSLNEDLLIYPNPTTGEIILDAEGIERIDVINIHEIWYYNKSQQLNIRNATLK